MANGFLGFKFIKQPVLTHIGFFMFSIKVNDELKYFLIMYSSISIRLVNIKISLFCANMDYKLTENEAYQLRKTSTSKKVRIEQVFFTSWSLTITKKNS